MNEPLDCPIADSGRGVNAAVAELASIHRWVCWRLMPSKVPGKKADKVPFQTGGRRPAKSTDPTTWDDFDSTWLSAFVDGNADDDGFPVTCKWTPAARREFIEAERRDDAAREAKSWQQRQVTDLCRRVARLEQERAALIGAIGQVLPKYFSQ